MVPCDVIIEMSHRSRWMTNYSAAIAADKPGPQTSTEAEQHGPGLCCWNCTLLPAWRPCDVSHQPVPAMLQ